MINECIYCGETPDKLYGNCVAVQVACDNCGAKGPKRGSEHDALNAWNKGTYSHPSVEGDNIVYLLKSNGGGIDGRDPNDKRGRIQSASFNKGAIEANVSGWTHMVSEVHDMTEVARKAFASLDPLQRLALKNNLSVMFKDK